MVRRKYLIKLIALYGLINTINSANGKLFSMIPQSSTSLCNIGDRCLFCPSEENYWNTVKWFKNISNEKNGIEEQIDNELVIASVF